MLFKTIIFISDPADIFCWLCSGRQATIVAVMAVDENDAVEEVQAPDAPPAANEAAGLFGVPMVQ